MMRRYELSEFKEKLVIEMNSFLKYTKCGYQAVIKSLFINGTEKEIIVLEEPSTTMLEEVLNANVYWELELLYSCYLNGYSIFEIAESIAEKFLHQLEINCMLTEQIKSLKKEDILRNITVRLLPGDVRTQNGFSYVGSWNDLSVALCVNLKGLKAGLCLTDELLRWFSISAEEAFLHAFDKIKEEEYELLDSLTICKELREAGIEVGVLDNEHMYLYSSAEQYYGTKMIFNKKPLKELADKLGSDLYLCATSVHEWIIVSVDEIPLSCLIEAHQVLQSVMEQQERLSDSIYIYKRDLDSVGKVSVLKLEKEV